MCSCCYPAIWHLTCGIFPLQCFWLVWWKYGLFGDGLWGAPDLAFCELCSCFVWHSAWFLPYTHTELPSRLRVLAFMLSGESSFAVQSTSICSNSYMQVCLPPCFLGCISFFASQLQFLMSGNTDSILSVLLSHFVAPLFTADCNWHICVGTETAL